MINQKALDKLLKVDLTGDKLVKIFQSLAQVLENQPVEQASMILGYVADIDLLPSDLVPVIHFVLARHNPLELQNDTE